MKQNVFEYGQLKLTPFSNFLKAVLLATPFAGRRSLNSCCTHYCVIFVRHAHSNHHIV
jgi:hypothetical protein